MLNKAVIGFFLRSLDTLKLLHPYNNCKDDWFVSTEYLTDLASIKYKFIQQRGDAN